MIKGLDIGVNGMCVGEKRTLNIPPYLAYGYTAITTFEGDLGDYWEDTTVVPNCAYLEFEIELLDIV